MFFEGRSSHGGYSVKQEKRTSPKKSKARKDSGKKTEYGNEKQLAETFYRFITNRLSNFKLVHNKTTGKSEKVPAPVSKKRLERDFQAMLQEHDADSIAMVLDWLTHDRTHKWEFRSVTSLWRNFPMLLERCARTLNPYTAEELAPVVDYLNNRFIWDDSDELESIVGRSLFAVEQVYDAVQKSGIDKELPLIYSIMGSPKDWVRIHLIGMSNSKSKTSVFVLTVDKVKSQLRGQLARLGIKTHWIHALDNSPASTYKRILDERQ